MPAKDTFTLHHRLCTLRKHKLSSHQTSQNSRLPSIVQCSSLSRILCSSDSTKLPGATENSGIQPRSPSYRAPHHHYVHLTAKLISFQLLKIHRSSQNYPPNLIPASWSFSSPNKIVWSFPSHRSLPSELTHTSPFPHGLLSISSNRPQTSIGFLPKPLEFLAISLYPAPTVCRHCSIFLIIPSRQFLWAIQHTPVNAKQTMQSMQ